MDIATQLKLPEATNPQVDNIYKKMYTSCSTRPKNEYYFSNYIGIICIFGIGVALILYRKKIHKKGKKGSGITTFMQNHDIVKLIIGLLLLNHIRELSNSMVTHIIHPVIDPLIPFIQCTISIKYGDDYIEIGNFITDFLIFVINLIILYILYLIMISY